MLSFQWHMLPFCFQVPSHFWRWVFPYWLCGNLVQVELQTSFAIIQCHWDGHDALVCILKKKKTFVLFAFQTLNLSNPHTFRDLSKPMGAQTTERKQKFIQRYKEVEKSEGEHFRRLTDSRGFKACLQIPWSFQNCSHGKHSTKEVHLLLCIRSAWGLKEKWPSCQHFLLMCLTLQHFVFFPWAERCITAEGSVREKIALIVKLYASVFSDS